MQLIGRGIAPYLLFKFESSSLVILVITVSVYFPGKYALERVFNELLSKTRCRIFENIDLFDIYGTIIIKRFRIKFVFLDDGRY